MHRAAENRIIELIPIEHYELGISARRNSLLQELKSEQQQSFSEAVLFVLATPERQQDCISLCPWRPALQQSEALHSPSQGVL